MRVRTILGACIVLGAACDQNQSPPNESERSEGPIKEQIGEPAFKSRVEAVDDEEPALAEQTQALVGDALCKPCASNAECGTNNYCLRRSDGVRFCGRDCRTSACPSSYSCMRLSTTVAQCVPPQLDCSHVPQDAGVADAGVADAGPRDAAVDASSADAATSDNQVPNTPACSAASGWSATWSGFEDEVLRLSNQFRTAGASCGGTSYAAAPALRMNPALRCAARLHSRDMQLRNFFSHTNPDGVTFDKRITAAGYNWRTVGENIAAGYQTPAAVVQGWMQSTGHCQNIMNPAFTEIGVGFYDSYRWTQDFGTGW